MKTLTEFAGLSLKNAAKAKQELSTSGKTAEELPAALGESLKLEGDRLTFLMNSLEMLGEKHTDLKRVVVFTLAENEKPPAKAILKGEHYYLLEYYPSLNPQPESRPSRDDSRGGRGGNRGDKKSGNRSGGKGGRPQQPSPERAPRPPVDPSKMGLIVKSDVNSAATPGKEGEPRQRRPRRAPRKPMTGPVADPNMTAEVIQEGNVIKIVSRPRIPQPAEAATQAPESALSEPMKADGDTASTP